METPKSSLITHNSFKIGVIFMLNIETPSKEVIARAEKIVADCSDAGYSFKDFELLVQELEKCREDLRESLRTSALPALDRTIRF